MKTQHTPGPWVEVADKNIAYYKGDVQSVDGVPIAKIHTGVDEHAANTKLIAQSPSLLWLAQWFSNYANEHPEWESEQFPAESPEREWLDNLRATITKATL